MSTKMEQPFYDDSFLSAYGHSEAALHDFKFLKQNMNVTFAEPYRSYKTHLRASTTDSDFFNPANSDAAAASLKLASPELERLINGNGVITTTPTPGQYLPGYHHSSVSRGIATEDQEGFVDGFVKALDEMHKLNQMAPPPNVSIGAGGMSTCSVASSVFAASLASDNPIYTTLNSCGPNTNLTPAATHASYPTTTISYLPHHPHYPPQQTSAHIPFHHQHALSSSALHPQRLVSLKEEPQTVPDLQSSDGGSPPMSPIDMEDQERVKAERKRLRNRLAATKCRKRKLERIARLEDKVKVLKTDNAGLSSAATLLREQVAQLKRKVMTHVNSGCQLALTPKIKSY
ncbi:junB proto-oncogene, AP-1 transcription factor subunit a isoform X1 [Alosa alosa]|uniref:transcription factor jun-B-like isoform X1 n=1 Tax=Alosa sapidissima TaxID=34773 RepID=UPI001C084FB0|nr:transcription factor jun-B-like isoform X1 [Alosa sapidissima]XP_048103104.1 junB proto-oncogene, AP-1 transcription factor subunit a isoform X1 [Alosa alosa]